MEKPAVLSVVGQTASGKSALAVSIAEHIRDERIGGYAGAEIISADSRQVYRGLDIGSGKVTGEELRGIPHHLLDVADPRERFSVERYRNLAEGAIREAVERKMVPILCGGTGLYVDAVLCGVTFPPVPPNEDLRKKLAECSQGELFQRLSELDPRRASEIDRKNRRRLERAIEIAETLGAVPEMVRETPYRTLELGIAIEGEKLNERIAARLRARLDAGMVEEVKRLAENGLSWERLEELGLEYRYLARYLKGAIGYEEMVRRLEREIRAYARRQLTWFKKNKNIVWITSPDEALARVRNFLSRPHLP